MTDPQKGLQTPLKYDKTLYINRDHSRVVPVTAFEKALSTNQTELELCKMKYGVWDGSMVACNGQAFTTRQPLHDYLK